MIDTIQPTPEEIRRQTAETIIKRVTENYPVADEVFIDSAALEKFITGIAGDCFYRLMSQFNLKPDLINGTPNDDAKFLFSLQGLIEEYSQARFNAAYSETSIRFLFGKKK